jgi:large subunit ribosomal protein L24
MVKNSFATTWKSSTQTRKQRKYAYNAPLHIKQKMVSSHLSPELRKKHGFRNVQVKKGDKVRVMKGQYSKKEAKVDRIDLKRERVYLTGVEVVKKDGTKLPLTFIASNLMIIELNLADKKRKQKLEQKNKEPAKKETAKTPVEPSKTSSEKKAEVKK